MMNDEYKKMLKRRVSVMCSCKKKKSQIRDRGKYGTCRCDSYTFHWKVGNILANCLFQYLADAKNAIECDKEHWDTIEKHAQAIRDYANANSDDAFLSSSIVVDIDRKKQYRKKEKAWKEAMSWLTKNWNDLWW